MSEEENRGYLDAQKVEIKYTYARFYRRVFANLTDFIIFAFCFVGLFLGCRGITMATPAYQENETGLMSIRTESGLYMVYPNSGKSADIVSFLMDDSNNYTGFAKMDIAREAVDTFIHYVAVNVDIASSEKVQKDYDEYRLNPKLAYKNVSFFKKEGDAIIHNPDCEAKAEDYFNKAYAPYIDEHAQGYLVTLVPSYLEKVHNESYFLIFAEVMPAYLLAPFIVYLLPMFIFRRGRMTFGKALYHIGVVDKNLMVPSYKRTLARFAIFYGAELILSVFTFAIPFLVSASLMAFSRAHQGFPDYLLRLYEVDTSNSKLYFSREEILLSGVGGKKPVNFKPEYED